MGTFVIYEDSISRSYLLRSQLAESDADYAALHAGATSSSIGATEYVGQRLEYLSFHWYYTIIRGLGKFDTSCLSGYTPTAVAFSFFTEPSSMPSVDSIIHVVKGSGTGNPTVNTDYAYLGLQNTSYGSLNVPAGGLPSDYYDVTLDASGLAELNTSGFTTYGLRGEDDISSSSTPPDSVWNSYIPVYRCLLSLLPVAVSGYIVGGKLYMTGILDNTKFVTSKPTTLLVDIAEDVYGSNVDVCFKYDGTNYSDWIPYQEVDVNFTDSVTFAGTDTSFQVYIRVKKQNGTYTYYLSNSINAYAIYPTNPITRVTSIIHTYNRLLGEYKLQAGMGGVLAEFDIPTSVVTPAEAKEEEPPLVVPETVIPKVEPLSPPTFDKWIVEPAKPKGDTGMIFIPPEPLPPNFKTTPPKPGTPPQQVLTLKGIVNTPEGIKRKTIADKLSGYNVEMRKPWTDETGQRWIWNESTKGYIKG